ncbi:MAG: replicative DNA helicase [Parcubacteria group bacterium]|nr:replicative DNA helicase [Parcubacteria group bacterium]
MAQNLRIPPQSLDAEMALLGSIMLRPEAMYEITDIINPGSFYAEKHRLTFDTMLDLFKKSSPIDLLSLSSRLEEKKMLEQIGGASYLTELVNTVPSSANVKHYADIVQKKYMMRELIRASEHISILGYDEATDLENLLDEAEKTIFNVTKNFSSNQRFKELKPLLHEAYERLEKLSSSTHELRGVPTGFKSLDDMLAGFQKSDLIILAARPSVGKTALALDIARRTAVNHGTEVGIFSLEMSSQQLVDRIMAAQSRVDSWMIRKGKVNDDGFTHIRNALDELSRAPIFIDDQPGNNILKMRSVARKLKSEKGLKLLIVDYLQLMLPTSSRANDSTVQQVTEISRSLKNLARELEIPVIALSQLSRAVEQRGGRPRLSDLRDSGSIEQDADVVMFIHSDEQKNEDGRRDPVMEKDIIIAKHRNGPVGEVKFKFDSQKTTFVELDHSHYSNADKELEDF